MIAREWFLASALAAACAATCSIKASPAERLVYNRVAKASSGTTTHLLHQTTGRGLVRNGWPFFPNATTLRAAVQALPVGGVYVNHCGALDDLGPGVAWVNVVREPIARIASDFYYKVDASSHSGDPRDVAAAIEARRRDDRCGCAALEFDACVRSMARNNCSFDERWPLRKSQLVYFCPAGAGGSTRCAGADARARAASYAFVGIAEEYELTVAALERLLPRYFREASALAAAVNDRRWHTTALVNNATGTSGNGCISGVARDLFRERWGLYADEVALYDQVKRRFWCTVAALGLV